MKMIEPLRKRIVEAEAVLRSKYALDDDEIDRLNNAHWLGSFAWSMMPPDGKDAVTSYLKAMRTLATEENQEIEELKMNK